MYTLFSTPYWIMREDDEQNLVELKRTDRPFDSNFDVALEEDRVGAAFVSRHATYGIVIDLRLTPPGSSPQSENAMRRLLASIAAKFARVAALHKDRVALQQLLRSAPNGRAEIFPAEDEREALEFAKNRTSREAGDDPIRVRSRVQTENPIDEAMHWARELGEWALAREKVISKLDVRGSRRARSLARELRRTHDVLNGLADGKSPQGVDAAPHLKQLAALRREAVELMFAANLSPNDGSTWAREEAQILSNVRADSAPDSTGVETFRPGRDQ